MLKTAAEIISDSSGDARLLAEGIDRAFDAWWSEHGQFATGGLDERETARLAWMIAWLVAGRYMETQ